MKYAGRDVNLNAIYYLAGRSAKPVSSKHIQVRLGLSRQYANRLLSELVDGGFLVRYVTASGIVGRPKYLYSVADYEEYRELRSGVLDDYITARMTASFNERNGEK